MEVGLSELGERQARAPGGDSGFLGDEETTVALASPTSGPRSAPPSWRRGGRPDIEVIHDGAA